MAAPVNMAAGAGTLLRLQGLLVVERRAGIAHVKPAFN